MVLGLDVATVTGFAWYDTKASKSSVKTGLIKATGENAEEKAASLAIQLVAILKVERPDFVAIEQPMRNIKSFRKTKTDLAGVKDEATINPNALQLDVIERCIDLWSNPGDVVLTPFLGVGSEVYCAVNMGRKGIGFELKPSYFPQAARNIAALYEAKTTDIFHADRPTPTEEAA